MTSRLSYYKIQLKLKRYDMKLKCFITLILCILGNSTLCQQTNLQKNFTKSLDSILISRNEAIKALEFKRSYQTCLIEVVSERNINSILSNRQSELILRIDSVSYRFNNQLMINGKQSKELSLKTKKLKESRLENWAWRGIAVLAGYLIFK